MFQRILGLGLLALAGVLPLVPSPARVQACAPVYRTGEDVEIASESAIIAWDAESGTEHFIRRGTFATSSADFGFLVPTPSEPELAEASADAFTSLAAMTAPRVEYQERVRPHSGFACSDATMTFESVGSAVPSAAKSVSVEKQQRVGAYDATVLKATDAQTLTTWLEQNGYQSRPELVDWLQIYVDQKWYITAFKMAGQSADPTQVVTSPGTNPPAKVDGTTVRMTFKTDKPFYPYREPVDARAGEKPGKRLLRVFFVSNARYEGTIGTDTPWPGQAEWAKPVAADRLAHSLSGTQLPAGENLWLTEFEDSSSPRPGTDEVYFRPATSQTELERKPIIHYTYVEGPAPTILWVVLAIIGMMPILGIIGVFLVFRWWWRRRSA